MLEGIVLHKSITGSFCFTLHEISNDLKEVIRGRLSEICYGAAKASRNSNLYSYQRTLSAFFERFDSKPPNTQKGMIGELLTHMLFLHYESDFRSASAYFNLEENSIKKGFDLVLHNNETSQIWFVEVKAGECGQKTSIQKLGGLLSLAKNDLKTALDSERNTLWQNAINGATVVVNETSLKAQIETLLENYNEQASLGKSTSENYNAILVAVSFSGFQTFATGGEFEHRHQNQKNLNEFQQLMSVALQKDTLESVVNFLRSEAEGG